MAGYILVIDDDEAIRRLISEALAEEGYRVEVAGSAAEGLQAVSDERPAVIFLDMRMPDDGPRFKHELERRSSGARIVAMSASREGHAWAKGISADAFLFKPFDIADLFAAVSDGVEPDRRN